MAHFPTVVVVANGTKIVSPPIRGRGGLNEVVKVCDVLQQLGGKIDRRCGIHVHHDADQLTVADVARFAAVWQKSQKLIESQVPPSRVSNNYCRRFNGGLENPEEWFKAAKDSPHRDAYAKDVRRVSVRVESGSEYNRYAQINLLSSLRKSWYYRGAHIRWNHQRSASRIVD